jgi:hypothetical protein
MAAASAKADRSTPLALLPLSRMASVSELRNFTTA